MPNIHLISNISNNNINRSFITRLAWFFVKSEGIKFSYAMERAWREHVINGRLERIFWTDASLEQIDYIIKTCGNNPNKIRKWDYSYIKHPLDWVSYQLKRQGYKITKIKADITIKREIIAMDISEIKHINKSKLIGSKIFYTI